MSRKKPRPFPVPHDPIAGISDAHTHLWSCGARDAEAVRQFVRRAQDAGVEKLVTVGDDLAESEAVVEQATWDPAVYAACAIHPTKANELDQNTRQRLRELVAHPQCVAVGETGLDYYWLEHEPDTTASKEQQEEALRFHIDLAVESGKTLMIHNCEGDTDLLRILADAPKPRYVQLHCFSSPLAVAEEALSRGYILSFAGNVTFKRNEELREAARIAPAGQILIETDAPYMTPEPFRGGKNEPSLIGHTFARVAEVRGEEPEELATHVSRTFDAIFGLSKKQHLPH